MDVPEDDEEPSISDCCGSGCNPCILDVRKNVAQSKEHCPNKNALDQSNYVRFIITEIKEMAEEYLILVFNLKDPVEESIGIILKIGQYIIIRISNISRAFTPISWSGKSLTILVKIYKDGQMSKLIKERKVNDEIDIRGPYGNFIYHRNSYNKILMYSIGSGIAAMIPIINSIIFDDLEDTQIYLNSSFRYFSTVPFKGEFRRLSDYWNFSCTLFLTQEDNNNILSGIKLLNRSRLCKKSIEKSLGNNQPETTLILICGTKKFNEMAKAIVEKYNFKNNYIFE